MFYVSKTTIFGDFAGKMRNRGRCSDVDFTVKLG
jgi:hypothetical protein